jgi:hypothetical protein
MTYLLWIRTKRRITTYDDADLEKLMTFEAALRFPPHFGRIEVRDPIEGEDQLLYQVESLARIHDVATAFSTVMDDYFVDDWCLTEVGNALAPLPVEDEADDPPEQDDDGYNDDDDSGSHEDKTEPSLIPDGFAFALPELGFGGLSWNTAGIAGKFLTGATGLWVDLERDLEEAQHLLRELERTLPRPTKRMWTGRRSILFAYQADQSFRSRNYMGLSESVREMLDGNDVAMWVAFQIGNWSVGGVLGDMGQMADFIRKLPSRKVA